MFAAIINLDRRPIDPAGLVASAQSSSRRLCQPGGARHVVLLRDVDVSPMRDLETSAIEELDGRFWLVGRLRLDGRGDLAARLDVSMVDAAVSEAGLVLRAYARWGDSFLDHVFGDYAFVLWDAARDTLIAAIDHLSDLDRGWRTTASPFLAQQLQSGRIEPLPDLTRRALEALREALASPGFLAAALQRRSARAVGLLGPVSSPPAEIHLDSTLRHSARAFCHLSANDDKIDVAYPGGHLYIHRGAESGVLFMLNTATFKVRDLPGSFDDEVRLSLAQRFCDAGLLEPVTAED